MTAYGRAISTTPAGRFIIEIQSVNRKFLDITIDLPPELSQFELELKKWVIPHLTRGQVTIKVAAFFEDTAPIIVRPNLALARQLRKAWDAIAHEIGVKEDCFSLSLISDTKGLLHYDENEEDEALFRQILKETLEKAFHPFLQMKKQEGLLLQNDIMERLEKIRYWIKEITIKIPGATEKYRQKLIARLEELLPGHIENEERILREVALFAEKIDIAEEITRLYCHLTHFEELISSETVSIGKTIEFIIQELNREINTVGSKSADSVIARLVIDVKSELERIREQIQNIE